MDTGASTTAKAVRLRLLRVALPCQYHCPAAPLPLSTSFPTHYCTNIVAFVRTGSTPRFLRTGQSSPQPVTLQEWLQRAGRLNNVTATKVPPIALRCMQQLAAFPRGSIGRTDLPATIRAVNTTLACATAVRAKPRLLSDLGKTLQAQPDLRRGLRRSPEFRAHVASLFALAAADPCSFSDAVNASQLATAQIKTGHYSPPFWTGLERAGLRGLPPRQFANVVYAAAKLHADLAAPRPSPGLQQRVWHAVEAGGHRMAAGMSPQHVSNVWWALATLGLEVPPATLDVLKAATVRVAPEMAPQNVSIVLWAWASMQLAVEGLVVPMEAAVAAVAPRANAQAVANTLWAWATLRLRPERILPPLTATLPRVVPLMSDQHLSNVCWAWGALMLPAAEAVPILQAGFLRLAAEGEVSEQALSNVWWAWARLHVSDDGIAACFHAVLARHAQHAEPLTAVVVLKAVATLARPPPPPLFMQLMRVVTQGGEEMGVWECSNVLWGLGVMAVVRGGPVSVATARGGAPAAEGDAVAAAYDEAVQHLATRLLEFHESDTEFAQEALNQVRHHTLCWACSTVPARLLACVCWGSSAWWRDAGAM